MVGGMSKAGPIGEDWPAHDLEDLVERYPVVRMTTPQTQSVVHIGVRHREIEESRALRPCRNHIHAPGCNGNGVELGSRSERRCAQNNVVLLSPIFVKLDDN